MDNFILEKDNGLEKFIKLGLSHLWIVYEEERVIAFFALSKDALVLNSEDKRMLELNNKSLCLPANHEEKFWCQEKYSALEIDYLAVSNKEQKQGLGSFIVAAIEKYAKEDKLSSTLFLTVEAFESKEYSSTEFYCKCGFEFSEVGKRRNESKEIYGEISDRIRMYKRLI